MTEPYREPPPKEGDDDVANIGAYPTVVEAEMAREYLKSHGINAVVYEVASFNPIVNEALGGARIVVRSGDADHARSLLTRLARTQISDEDDGEVGEVRCPRCELAYCFYQTVFETSSSRAAGLHALMAIPSLLFGSFARKRWRCHKCMHVWDDPKEGPEHMTPLGPDDPRPVFRLRRHRGGSGFLIGVMLMAIAGTVTSAPDMPSGLTALTFLLPIIGYAIGSQMVTDECSAPGCRAVLAADAEICPVCRGAIAGVIRSAHDHFAEAASFRRDLALLKARDEQRALKKKKKRAPKPLPSKPSDAESAS